MRNDDLPSGDEKLLPSAFGREAGVPGMRDAMRQAEGLQAEGRMTDAISVLRGSIARLADEPDRADHVAVAEALQALARLLDDEDEDEAALAVRREIASRFGDADDAALREIVNGALGQVIRSLREEKRYEEMLEARELLLQRLDEHPPSGRPYAALDNVLGKAWILRRLGRVEEELVVHDEVLRRAGDRSDPEVLHNVGLSLARKAGALIELGRCREAVEVVDQMLDRLSSSSDADFRAELSQGLLAKAEALGSLGHWQPAIAAVVEAEKYVVTASEPELRTRGALLLALRGYLLQQLGDCDGALAAWAEAATRYGADTSRSVTQAVVTALAQAIKLLLATDRIKDSTPVNDALLARLQMSTDSKLTPLYAPAFLAKAHSLAEEGQPEVAMRLIDEVLDRLGKSETPDVATQTALAITAKLITLEELDRGEEAKRLRDTLARSFGPPALAAFDQIADSLDQQKDIVARKQRAGALASKAALLIGLNRDDDASAVANELVDRYRDDANETIQRLVKTAHDGLR